MLMYDRYADDSNQAAVFPAPGYRYDSGRKKVVYDQNRLLEDQTKNDDERLADVLRDIANDVQQGIVMEKEYPSNNSDCKMPVLDMKVWMDQDGIILYQHFEKPMASKKVMHAQSAQSGPCKRNVHKQEVLRRLLNSSARLDWDSQVAPVITTYMGRMKHAGYSEL